MQALIFRGLLGLTVLLTFAYQQKLMSSTPQVEKIQESQMTLPDSYRQAQTNQQYIQTVKNVQDTQSKAGFPQT